MSDFYAFLPSNASPDVYTQNKTSHFQIELAQRVELHGKWKCALIEVHHPNTMAQVLDGDNTVTLQTEHMVDTVSVRPGCYPTKKSFLIAVKNALSVLGNNFHTEPLTEDSNELVTIQPLCDQGQITFAPRLALQLGLDSHGPVPAHQPIHGVKPVDMTLGIPSQLFVYMDILADQIVGHVRAPLLRAIPVDVKAAFGTLSVYHCDHPIYFELSTKSFDTVTIYIKDHAGRSAPFEFGTALLLVHFRQEQA